MKHIDFFRFLDRLLKSWTLIVLLGLASFTAFAVSLSESTPLHFGSIPANAGSICAMDESGSVSGECIGSDLNISVGVFTISDLVGNSQVEVIVSGLSSASLGFTAIATITGGKGGKTTITDGQPAIIDVKGNGADLSIEVYGQLVLVSSLTTSVSHTVDFSVQVNEI